MHVHNPKQKVLLATDWRLRADKDLDFTEPDGAPHVLDMWTYGRRAVGNAAYNRMSRLALFTPGDMPSVKEAAFERAAFLRYIEEAKPRHVLIIPTPTAQLGEMATSLRGTHVWNALRAPDSLDAMRGTWWQFNEHTTVTAMFPAAARIKELQRWCIALWMRRAHKGRLLQPKATYTCTSICPRMLTLLESMAGRSVAVDLEFIPSTDKTTAVGFSDGVHSVSIPWHTFMPAGQTKPVKGIFDVPSAFQSVAARIMAEVATILSDDVTKFAHNFVADIPRLQSMGFVVNGTVHDTFAAHAIAFPELRHALQLAASHLLPCPPWKSLYKPRTEKYLNRDDEEFWTCDPVALREYNARDAFYTWHLAQAVMPWVEADG